MATIKSFTTLEQSKVLAEILPLESADMCYIQDLLAGGKYGDYKPYIGNLIPAYGQDKIKCWSLAALLNALPNGIVMNKDSQNGRYHFSSTHIGTYVIADNPIDACVAMIEKLNEKKLL